MASDRRYDSSELVRLISSVEKFTISTGTKLDTTIATTAVVAGDASLTVAAILNAADADYIALIGQSGEGDLHQVSGAPAGSTITTAYKTAIGAAIGSRVVEMTRYDLGHVDESGVTMTGSANIVDIPAATSKLPLGSYVSTGTLGGSMNLRGFNASNFQTVFGIPENVSGAGTTSDPYRALATGLKMGTEAYTVLRTKGQMLDGTSTFWLDFVNCTVAPSLNVQVGGANAATLGLQFRCTSTVLRVFK